MSGLQEYLKEGTTILISSQQGLKPPFSFRVRDTDLGTLSFDESLESGEFQWEKGTFHISRDIHEQKVSLKQGKAERVCCYEKSATEGPMLMTEDSQIFFLKGSGLWKRELSLVEYESGCWFFRFHPEQKKEAASLTVEVCPIIGDTDYFLELLVLSVFMLIGEDLSEGDGSWN